MEIPESIKIAGLDWKVVLDEHMGAEDKCFGQMRPVRQEIAIIAHAAEQRQEETLLHEIIEAIKDHCCLELDHQTLSTLSAQLHQVLKDNRLKFFD